ncbi:MAG: hypothetical protein V4436_02145 [Patescibacteria group bacterium]
MNKVLLALKSRTIWTIVLMFVIGGVNAVSTFIPPVVEVPLMGALSFLAMYFHVNPSQNYTG